VYGTGYAALTGIYLLCALLSPALALQLDTTKYVRVIAQAEAIALQAAQKATVADAVAAAAVIPTPTSVAVKVVAAGLAIGVPLGLALWQTYYSGSDLTHLVSRFTQPAGLTLNGQLPGAWASCPSSGVLNGISYNCSGGSYDYAVEWGACSDGSMRFPYLGSTGWGQLSGQYVGGGCPDIKQVWVHLVGGANPPTVSTGSPPTQAQVSASIQNLSSSDTDSVENHTTPAGVGVAPVSAPQVTTLTQVLTDLNTAVKKLTDLLGTDIVVAQNVPPPQNVTITTNVTTNTTNVSNVSSVTNADGSTTTTEQKAETSSASCTSNAKDPRTFATVLQAHQQLWQATGLVASLNALKNLTFPGAVPVITLPTHLFGTFTLDFTRWAWVFTAIQSIMIAFAGMVAIRIVFVGR